MSLATSVIAKPLNQLSAGKLAIASGVAGIIVYVFLIGYLNTRSESTATWILINRLNDGAAAFQFLFMAPVIVGLTYFSHLGSFKLNRARVLTAVIAVSLAILNLLLTFPKMVSVIFYMIPQGLSGICLILLNWRLTDLLSFGLRWFGIIVGFGLLLVGIFPIGFALFVDIAAMQIPTTFMKKFPGTPVNNVLHQLLFAGSLLGRRLLREKTFPVILPT